MALRTFSPSYAASKLASMHCRTMLPIKMGCGWSHTRNTFSWLTRPKPLAVACSSQQHSLQHERLQSRAEVRCHQLVPSCACDSGASYIVLQLLH